MVKIFVLVAIFAAIWESISKTKLNRADLILKPKLNTKIKIFVVLTLGSTEWQLAQLPQAAGTLNPN